ncbi:hypothetical protein PBI_SCTP2_170 [Salicola phage SCTP-2]|nr:hypothetical protein PBI_SCTP2_170 [Salicola phage SCTP-2]
MSEQNFEKIRAINENVIARRIEDDEQLSTIIEISNSKDTYCKAVVVSAGELVDYTKAGDTLIINAISPMIHKDDDGNEYYCVSEEQVYCRVS